MQEQGGRAFRSANASGIGWGAVIVTASKYFQKSIALNSKFDNFLAPRRPQGRLDSMFADR
jgi:hypothetical protein